MEFHPPRTLSTLLCTTLAVTLPLLFGACAPSSTATELTGQSGEELILLPPDPNINRWFGEAIAADDQTLIIGDHEAVGQSPSGPAGRGQVHVYNRTGTGWQMVQTLLPEPTPKTSEVHFGEQVVLHQNVLIVSAMRDGVSGNLSQQDGAFYLYTRPGTGQPFSLVSRVAAPTPAPGEWFGYYNATDGNFVASAAFNGSQGNDIYIYTLQGNTLIYRYSIEAEGKPTSLAITRSGVLVAGNGPGALVEAYRLQQNNATRIDTSVIPFGFDELSGNGDSVVMWDTGGTGEIAVATFDTARVTSFNQLVTLPGEVPNNAIIVEGQFVLASQFDPALPSLMKFQASGGSYQFSGQIYPPAASRLGTPASRFGEGIAVTQNQIAFGDPRPGAALVYVVGPEPNSVTEGAIYDQQQLLVSDACGNQCGNESFLAASFGRAVAMDGDLAVATTTENVTPSPRLPAAHLYTRGASAWQHAAEFSFSGEEPRDVAIDSGRVFVGHGALPNVANGFINGAVDVFENTGGTWSRTATLLGSDDGSFQSRFIGDAIDAEGDFLVAGSFGAVYVFQRGSGGAWSQVRKLDIPDFVSPQGFAHAVALSADYLAVGAKWDSSLGPRVGSVYIFRRSDWSLDQKLALASAAGTNVEYGYAVDIEGTTLAIGTPGHGTVSIQERTGSGSFLWETSGVFQPGAGKTFRVGTSVSLSGDNVLMGAPLDSLTQGAGGAAYLYRRVNGEWNDDAGFVLLPRDNRSGGGPIFGADVMLSGGRAIVAAPFADPLGFDSGAAFTFDGLLDADFDGIPTVNDCNDSDGLGVACPVQSGNFGFEPLASQAWTAAFGSFQIATNRASEGVSSLRLNAGTIKLNSPLLHSADLHEVGTHLSLDIFRQTVKTDAVTLFMSAPAFGVNEAVIGSVDITHAPANKWFTVTAAIPSALRDILLHQDTDVRFHIFFNSGGPNVFVDHLHFSRSFDSRVPSRPAVPSALSAALVVTSDWGSGYCAALKLSNSAATPTAGWQVLIDTRNSTITQHWNAAFSANSGSVAIASNQPWNSSIPAGATNHDVSVGFCANRASGTQNPVVVSATAL